MSHHKCKVRKNQMTVHRMLNRAAEQLGDETLAGILDLMNRQMQYGYRLMFPVLLNSAGVPQQSIALLAHSNDPRLRGIRGLKVSPHANHVFLCLAFSDGAEWLRYAQQITQGFPEQPQFGA